MMGDRIPAENIVTHDDLVRDDTALDADRLEREIAEVRHDPITGGVVPGKAPGEPIPPAERLLRQLGAQVLLALAALEDEREGDARRAVGFICADAGDLALEVASW